MPTSKKIFIDACPICQSRHLKQVFDLPSYPITERYAHERYSDLVENQLLMNCHVCGHVFLFTQLPAEILYDDTYKTASSTHSSTSALRSFALFVKMHAANLDGCAVADIGGNDGTLGRVLEVPAEKYFIVDPVAVRRPDTYGVITDLKSVGSAVGDVGRVVILSSHTLEHVSDVHGLFESLSSSFGDGLELFLQVPSLECLVSRRRWFQVSHQHLHYFSAASLSYLCHVHGLTITHLKFDELHYGALQVRIVRGGGGGPQISARKIGNRSIESSIGEFRAEFRLLSRQLARFEDGFDAYGAGLMFPILTYHLPALRDARHIVDDDPSKWGKQFYGCGATVVSPDELLVSSRPVVITGVFSESSYRILATKAIERFGWMDNDRLVRRPVVVPWREL